MLWYHKTWRQDISHKLKNFLCAVILQFTCYPISSGNSCKVDGQIPFCVGVDHYFFFEKQRHLNISWKVETYEMLKTKMFFKKFLKYLIISSMKNLSMGIEIWKSYR